MEKAIDQFVGLDPILGDQAKDELIKNGEASLDLVISRFGYLYRTSHLEVRLGQLFGHFGDMCVDRLMAVLQTGNWHKMIDTTYCFGQLNQESAAYKLVGNLTNNNIDIVRCSIDSLGYLGAKDWAFKILDLFPFDSTGLLPSNEGYKWEKLSYNVLMALLRMSVKEEEKGSIHTYRLPDIARFYRVAGEFKFKKLIRDNQYTVSTILSHFKPLAADSVIQSWLKSSIPMLQELGLNALKSMRLNRIVPVLQNYVELHISNDEIKRDVAEVLSNIQSKEAAEIIKYIFNNTEETSQYYKSICLHLAVALCQLEDKSFVERIYPSLLREGEEVAAHTYYSLGLLNFPESVWSSAINSEDYIIRGAIATIYGHRKGEDAIPILLQMERESSQDIEQLLILSSFINTGYFQKANNFREKLQIIGKNNNFRMLRYTWKREIILALKAIEDKHALAVWENLFGLDSQLALNELNVFGINETKKENQPVMQQTTSKTSNQKKIFISYSHKDKRWKEKLQSNLSSLRNQGFLVDWDDRQIEAGMWDSQIETAMENTDIFLLLVTHNFLSSSYITSKEITKAYSQFKAGKAKIFPIICDACAWQLQPITKTEKEWHPTQNKEMYVWLGKFQPFPEDGKPIKKWSNQQDAFLDITNQLMKIL